MKIIYENPDGTISVIHPAPGFTAEECLKDIDSASIQHKIVADEEVSSDRTFREAWCWSDSKAHDTSITKAKDIAHGRRRVKREEEFKPYDEIIMKQIPGADSTEAEAARSSIRSKYEQMQTDIDNCTTAEELKAIINTEGL